MKTRLSRSLRPGRKARALPTGNTGRFGRLDLEVIQNGSVRQAPCPWSAVAYVILCLSILLCSSVARAQSVAFINPGKSDEAYWVTATQGMQAAARSLGMTFEVQFAQREPLKTFEIAREMVARPRGKRPEYIMISDDAAVADQLLKVIDAAGVKSFLAYSSIPADQRVDVGSPRGKYKGWLGSLEPLAEDAGYLTAHALIERGKREKAFGPDGKLHMLSIAGDHTTSSSIKRNQGMHRGVAEDPLVIIDGEVYAEWTRETSFEQAGWLYRRYPDAKLVWAGNDLMALGAMAAWERRGGRPGVDAWFSGINTSTEALEAIKSGRLTSLAGGHFIVGAWALVMIYDYAHGRDFADEGLELQRPMFAEFTPQLADRYLERFGSGFDGVDFTRYSKAKNPQIKRYNFGFMQLLEASP
jgi:ABC-type sugar transport system substrate-binding protein